MTTEQFLFSITFVFGFLQLITYTKVFEKHLETIIEALTINPPKWLKLLGLGFLYFSLFYQSFFWAKHFNII